MKRLDYLLRVRSAEGIKRLTYYYWYGKEKPSAKMEENFNTYYKLEALYDWICKERGYDIGSSYAGTEILRRAMNDLRNIPTVRSQIPL